MGLLVTTDPDEVARLAEAMVARDPVAYTVFASIADGVRAADAAAWAARPEDRPAALAARSHVTTGVGFSDGWSGVDGVDELAAAIAAMDPPTVSLGGTPDTVLAVTELLGRTVTSRMDQRLFRLDELIAPRPTDGSARHASGADAEWLARWYTDFAVEAFGRLPVGFDASRMVERGVRSSQCFVWTLDDGTPVAMAVAHPPVDGVSRIGPVYTPPPWRGRGYGAAVTATASRAILDAGDVAVLYTDLANPTSNRIYQRLGYRQVLDRTTVRFD